ncbi:Lactoylglutathione lyase [Treponema sp. JC4]|uniref:VOC family protein n=1 Tax=Treponema sp. JC4 TaxID=1124982 RepID=UPI00025B0CBC|nr:VOC family protein [Treponema sp. JC4]EID84158.1 Lactoylglutathione lyase [Treponema sp. JC4]
MIQAIHHFAIIVSSEKSVEFYTKFGFNQIFRKERTYDTVVLMEGYGIQIELFIDSNHPPRAVNPENIGLRHLALKVDNIENTIKELGLSDIEINTDWLGKRYGYIFDPDSLPVELHE